MSTIMTYGDYEFSPVPLVTIGKEYISTDGGVKIGARFNMTLNGTLTPIPDVAGINNTIPYVDELRDALAQDGCPFVISCNDSVLWSGNPIVQNINFDQSNNNWVQSIPYTVELDFHIEGSGTGESFITGPYVESVSEEWNLEFFADQKHYSWTLDTGTDENPYILNLSHTVSVKGRPAYTGCGSSVSAASAAKTYGDSLLSATPSGQLDNSTIGSLYSNFDGFYNHMRKVTTDDYAGTYNATENWLVFAAGTGVPGNALEDFTVRTEKSIESDLATISIEGAVQGVETVDYTSPYSVTTSAYDSASSYWGAVQDRLYYRCKKIHEDEYSSTRSLNIVSANESISHNPPKGTISYSYTYNDRPSNCITGALTETIAITDNNPTDVFAKIVVLGRALGPILQDINTVTESTRDINIEVLTKPSDGCSAVILADTPNNVRADVRTLLAKFETQLANNFTQVFKHLDTESWNPKEGRYSRNIGWTYQDCSSIPETSITGSDPGDPPYTW